MDVYSKVRYLGANEDCSCGYCKSSNTNFSHGMWADVLSVENYQNLIDRGWRRSGMYCYKPTLTRTCCPLYTIKCDARNLKLTKSQKKVLKRMSKFLKDGLETKNEERNENLSQNEDKGGYEHEAAILEKVVEKIKVSETKIVHLDESVICKKSENVSTEPCTSGVTNSPHQDKINIDSTANQLKREIPFLRTPRPGDGMDPSKPQSKKAKLIRLEKKQNKLVAHTSKEIHKCNSGSKTKLLEDFIKESLEGSSANKLELRLVRSYPPSLEIEETFEESYSLYAKYQMTVHKDPPSKCTKKGYLRFLIKSPLQLRLIRSYPPSSEIEETFEESYSLYVKYQMTIHNEPPSECTKSGYLLFLIRSPLQPIKDKNGPRAGYGSFHQQYWLNGKLIAVGVIDILPKCVSSVYFFYDPDYSFLSLGTYGTLRELQLVRSYLEKCSDLKYYYMGFYIHSCQKMRYKARYIPSYLLCPETYTWHSVEDSVKKLEISKYSRLNDDKNAECEDSKISLNNVLILWEWTAMTYEVYKSKSQNKDEKEVKEYAQLVGRNCSQNMLLYRE